MNTDPFVRYVAGLILVLAFLGCLLIAVHGYWTDQYYQVPPVVVGILTAALSGALTILGVHVGNVSTSNAVGQTAAITRDTVTQFQNGGGKHAQPSDHPTGV